MDSSDSHHNTFSRRRFMRNVAGTGIATLVSSYASAATILPATQESANVCLFTPAAIEGPYYINGALLRSDVREDRTGLDLRLKLQVVDTDHGCAPISNAAVDIWHCDANGYYSGYPEGDPNMRSGPPRGNPPPPPPNNEGGRDMHAKPTAPDQHFLRGTQVSNAEGKVEFLTIYPGWYYGRAVHIHFKVYLNRKEMITSQLFFADEVNDQIFSSHDPYRKRGTSPMRNVQDMIEKRSPNLLTTQIEDDAVTGSFIIGVKRT